MEKRRALFLAALLPVGVLFAQRSDLQRDSLPSVALDEVKVFSSFAPRPGVEPVVATTLNGDELERRFGNQEYPEALKSVPSLFATKQGGGFGDSRITLRGFSSDNIGVLINGIPVNGMENGSVYWSNWSGLADVTDYIQVQRGIGLSKLGISSVGGTVNIITRGIMSEKGGFAYYGTGNDNYQKIAFGVSTGLTSNGWSVSMMGSRTWGDGYVNGTNFEAWSYFLNVSKRINADHLLSLTAFGAPQWHNRRSNKQSIADYEANRDGIRMNTAYGYINGRVVPTYSGYNEYHKPQISLNHFWTVNDRSTLTTSVYVSFATGGGRKVYGPSANRLQYNYKTGKPNAESDLTPDGLIDYGPVMADNKASDHGSDAIFTMGTNSHDWYGLLSTYTNRFTESLSFTAGIDGRYYKGYHYDKIEDLLGGAYFKDNKLAWRDPDAKLGVGDKVSQDYVGRILWAGGFTQLAYTRPTYKTFVSLSVTDYMTQREDPGKYGRYSNPEKYPADRIKTDWRHYVPVSVKAGFNYRLARIHNFFVNAGYITRAPLMDNTYVDNTPIADPVMEKIASGEIGYGLNLRNFSLSLSGYYTRWMDKSVTKAIGAWNGPKACIPNLDALHKGIELELTYQPARTVRLNGFFSIGDWRWIDDVSFTLLDAQHNKVGDYHAYVKDLHVGNAPQTSAALGVTWEPFRRFFIGADVNYYGRYYADFSPTDRTNPDDRSDAWRMPDFCTVDLRADYGFKMGCFDARLFGNVNNLLNTKYIADGLDGSKHDRDTALVWYGFGTTWTVGLKVQF